MAKAGYSVVTGADVAVVAATAKSILGLKSASDFGIDLKKVHVGIDGVTAADKPALLQLCYATFATNAPGTASTSVTPLQTYGRTIAHGITAARAWTTEPTVLTVLDEVVITPNGGTIMYDFPLGDTPDSAVSEGFVIRVTMATGTTTANARATFHYERA